MRLSHHTRCALAGLLLLLALPIRAQTSFTELTVGLPGGPTYDGSVVKSLDPGDFDGDGDFDLLVLLAYHSDANPSSDSTALVVYFNDGPEGTDGWAFTPVDVPLDGLGSWQSDLAWGDYDNDGDLDAVVVSDTGGALLRNDGGALVVTDTAIPLYDEGVSYILYDTHFDRRTLTWADYDNDGDLDLLMPGAVVDSSHVTALFRNDGSDGAGGWAFTLLTDVLPPATGAQTTWADNDDDGDLDLLVHNPKTQAIFPGIDPYTTVFRNDGGTFTDIGLPEIPVQQGMSDWADYDSDGDLDVLIAGLAEDFSSVVWLYRNDGGTYTQLVLFDNAIAPEPLYGVSGASWADYDGDGDVDVLAMAAVYAFPSEDIVGRAYIFVNDGGQFTRQDDGPPGAGATFNDGAFTWFDVDNDGDLDYLSAGYYFVDQQVYLDFLTRLFRNDAPGLNRAPSAPGGLAAEVEDDAVTLAWGPATDDHTPTDALTYNIWLQRGGSDIVSPMSRGGGTRLLPEPGNVSFSRTWTLHGLPEGEYTWHVQAVDNAFNGGAFADGGSFVIGEAALAVSAEPVGGPIVIPPEGGAFRFRVTITNVSGEAQTFRAWTEARLPDGDPHGPLYGPRRITLAPGAVFGPVMLSQSVPGSAPAGRYGYGVSVGGGVGSVVASDGFAFRKVAGEAARGGDGSWSVLEVGGPELASVGAGSELPSVFAVEGVYPNPARGVAVVRLDLPSSAEVVVRVFDVLGRSVLVSVPEAVEAGAGRPVSLDVSGLPSGVYVYRVEAVLSGGAEAASGRLTVVR